MRHKPPKLIFLAIPFGIGVFFLLGWIIQLIWNATIAEIFTSNPITYWQGILLILLFKILTGHNFSIHQKRNKHIEHSKAFHDHFAGKFSKKSDTPVDEETKIEI